MDDTMQPEESAADLVAQMDPALDGIDGLISVAAREGRVVALVTSRSALRTVRRELLGLGVPDRMLELQVIEEASIPYPIADERVRRWIEEADESGTLDAAVTVEGPSLRMTPGRIGKALLLLAIGWVALSTLLFILLIIFEWRAGS